MGDRKAGTLILLFVAEDDDEEDDNDDDKMIAMKMEITKTAKLLPDNKDLYI